MGFDQQVGRVGGSTLVDQAVQAPAVGKRTLTESLPVPATGTSAPAGAPQIGGDQAAIGAVDGTGAVSHPMVRMGSKGDDVRECQRKLNLHGASLVEDGVFGGQTDGAVRRFQSSQGIAVD